MQAQFPNQIHPSKRYSERYSNCTAPLQRPLLLAARACFTCGRSLVLLALLGRFTFKISSTGTQLQVSKLKGFCINYTFGLANRNNFFIKVLNSKCRNCREIHSDYFSGLLLFNNSIQSCYSNRLALKMTRFYFETHL